MAPFVPKRRSTSATEDIAFSSGVTDSRLASPPASPTRAWPAATDYTIVVQDPPSAFIEADLQRATVATDLLGMPLVASGQNAVVFRLDAETPGSSVAVRCFVKAPHEGAVRYHALEEHLAHAQCPVVSAARWRDQGVIVDGQWWPIVVMPWVVGLPLNLAVEDVLDDPPRLLQLADNLRAAVLSLQQAGIAHGDLQHGNVLVSDDLGIQMVDLDGVWVPGLTTGAPNETGHPNYQHPRRDSSHWGPYVDSFSALLIDLSLRALAADRSLFRFAGGESLIFIKADLENPAQTPVWESLASSPDEWVRNTATRLASACRQPSPLLIPYSDLLAPIQEVVETEAPSAELLRPLPPLPTSSIVTADNWWEDSMTGAFDASTSVAGGQEHPHLDVPASPFPQVLPGVELTQPLPKSRRKFWRRKSSTPDNTRS